MYVIEDRLIMMEFVIVQKHAFILFVSDSYRKEIQEAMMCISLLSFLFFTKHTRTLCRERDRVKRGSSQQFSDEPLRF
ncbi:hypothetical protein HanPSC8_Chr09g0394111 [Helianthus annuus]|nr:hypothetical protein HanPSC8_Chr09g0394111 [Helianthus annuus]